MMKKVAVKGFVILCAVVALCMFFSRTIATITTAKVQRINASKGKLEERIKLSGKVYFDGVEDVIVSEARKLAIVVDKLHVRAGSQVKAGDTIFTAFAPSYDEEKEKLVEDYEKKAKELAGEVASRIVYAQGSEHNNKYNAYIAATDDMYGAVYEALREAEQSGAALPKSYADWANVENKSEILQRAVDAIAAQQEAQNTYRKVYNDGGGRVGDSTFEHIKKCDGLRDELAAMQEKMLALDMLAGSLLTIKAPHDGYIVELAVKAGDDYDGKKTAYKISADGSAPILRADVTDVDKELADGTKLEAADGDATGEIKQTTVGSDGKKYAEIPLDTGFIKACGGLNKMLSEDTEITVKYKAKKSATLLPASAVRSEGENSYYVYVVSRSWGGLLSGNGYTVKKQTVTVLEKSDTMVAVAEDMQYMEIADREDRTLSDGLAVMDYVQ